MGIVASLAALPVGEEILRDERRRELQRLEEVRKSLKIKVKSKKSRCYIT